MQPLLILKMSQILAARAGSLLRFDSEDVLRATGWDVNETVNYGIGHHADPSAIYFLNPGTAMNHASYDVASVEYDHSLPGVLELRTKVDICAGEELFNDYLVDFGRCEWYDSMQKKLGNTPLSQLDVNLF